jgi:hypothetical protein
MIRSKMVPVPRKSKPTDFIKSLGVRLRNPETRAYLHLSGEGETKDVNYSWRGFVRQADALKERVTESGKEWPYRMESVRE